MSNHEARKAISQRCCTLFFKNVDYLRQKRGLSLLALKRELDGEDFTVSKGAIAIYSGRRANSSQYIKASTYYLAAFAHYFGEDLGRLMSVDYAAEASLSKSECK